MNEIIRKILGIHTQEQRVDEASQKERDTAEEGLRKNEAVWKLRVLQQGVLAEIAKKAVAGIALQSLLTDACVLVSEIMECDYCKIFQYQPHEQSFLLKGSSADIASISRSLFFNNLPHAQSTIMGKEPVRIEDLASDVRSKDPFLKEFEINSGLSLTIRHLEEPYGILGVYCRNLRSFSAEEIHFLKSLANILGHAIHRHEKDELTTRLALLVENSSEAIVNLDSGGIVLSWNRAAERIFGLTKEQIVGRNVSELVPSEQFHEFESAFTRLRSWDSSETLEMVRSTDDNNPKDLSISLARIVNEEGRMIGVSFTARDVTEQKQGAEKLRKSEMQLATAQRIGRMGSWEWELATGNLMWSDEEYRIYGLTPAEELTLEKFIDQVHPDDRQRVLEIASFPRPFALEHRIVRRDGEVRSVFVRGDVEFDAEGRPSRIIGISQDVTEVKRAEEQLRKSREQLRALSGHLQYVREEERSKIAREVHDELGQVLTALKMDLSLLTQKLMESSLVIPRRQLFSEIKSMTRMVDATIQSVRKIVTELRPEVLDHLGLKTAIEWQAQEFQSRTGIQCNLQAEFESFDVEDRDCATAIFRILQETLTNVARHSGANKVDIRLQQEGNHLILEVKDNGRGISDDELAKGDSFGILGMKERAVLMGGELEIEGKPGKGTVLTVKIPISSLRNLSDVS